MFKEKCEHGESTLAHRRSKRCLTRPHTVKYGSQYFLDLSSSMSSRGDRDFFSARLVVCSASIICACSTRRRRKSGRAMIGSLSRFVSFSVASGVWAMLQRCRRFRRRSGQGPPSSKFAMLRARRCRCVQSRLDGDAGQNGAWRATGKMFPSTVLSLRWMVRCWRVADMLWCVIVGWAAVGSSWRSSEKSTMGLWTR